MRFARYTFAIAGVYGILVLLPQYFLIEKVGVDSPPAVTHPEYYYGFIGLALTFQLVFLLIARDPMRYRSLMLVSIIEKLSFGLPTVYLYLNGRAPLSITGGAVIDLVLAVLFLIGFLKTTNDE
ncbi:MAG: hypothetical protein QUS14_06050 [Pyrinomonadaceae bacterium]|nr:hypothetical protein [Pyrinomonadaceae bacterium]